MCGHDTNICANVLMCLAISYVYYYCIAYSEMENARNANESESSEARMARLERTVKLLTEALRQQQN